MLKAQPRYCPIVDADKWDWQIVKCAADIDDRQLHCKEDIRDASIIDPRQDSIAAPVLQP
jgi:hypothetical protein